MIKIDRERTDEAGREIRPSEEWFDRADNKTQEAIDDIEHGRDHEWDGGTYAHRGEVKPALEKLFHDKCAYCETLMTASSDWDVEHFRPKGRVHEAPDHPGYYWLAYTWENLYPSCQHCNQRRKDAPRWDDPASQPAAGKADQFPLEDEATRAQSPDDDIADEATLLIDPCYDDPTDYLGHDPVGNIFALADNPYGEETIEVLHLGRRRLRDNRRRVMQRVVSILKAIRKVQQANDPDMQEVLDNLSLLLSEFIADDGEYAGAARFVVDHLDVFLAD